MILLPVAMKDESAACIEANLALRYPLIDPNGGELMYRILRLAFAFIAAAATAACGSDSPNGRGPLANLPTQLQPEIRVLHASADAPNVDVLLNNDRVLNDVAFKGGSGFLAVPSQGYRVRVEGRLPAGNQAVIDVASLTLSPNQQYTVVALGNVAAIEPLVLERERSSVPAGSVRAQVLHAAPNAPRVDVFVTTPGANLAATAPLGTFSFKQSLGPVDVPAGNYQIRVTPAGVPGTVVFDSGTINLAAGSDLLLAAVPYVGPGASPIQLVVMNGTGVSEILDRATPVALRVVHDSPDAPPVDVVVNDNFASPLIRNLSYPNFAGYVEVPAAQYNVKVTPAGNPGVIAINANLSLVAGRSYSVYAVNPLSSIEALVLEDDTRPIATQAKVRIVHGSPAAGRVDIYVTAPGASIASLAPNFANIALKQETGFVSLAAGTYTVTVTPAGTKTPAIGPLNITVAAGGVYTAVARDAVGGGAPLGLILLDDFVP